LQFTRGPMAAARYDILGFGNAIVDVLARAEDDLLLKFNLHKGGMQLVDEPTAQKLYAAMTDTKVVSGGSAANTIIGAAGLGLRAAFVGRVRDDELGKMFADDIRKAKVDFFTPPAADGPTTGSCFVFVTPDGQRTMNTFLGACQDLSENEVDAEIVANSSIIYLEGYLWDPPAAKAAFVKASKIAREAGQRVALSLSDAFCVDRYRDEFLALIKDGVVQILFANEHELKSLYQTSDFDTAVGLLRQEKLLAVVTRSELGCIVIDGETSLAVPAFPVESVVDTTGAGDLFAAGFLAGLVKGKDMATCAQLGAMAAAEIIQHIGARPEKDLAKLAADNGLVL